MASQKPRPYIHLLRPRLQELADEHWDAPETLIDIHAELLHRTWQGSINLREKIRSRLDELSKERFVWPTTIVFDSKVQLDSDHFKIPKSPLKALGYTVGRRGPSRRRRREVLDSAYLGNLPHVCNDDYMKSWGTPKKCSRLKKMADFIASMARNNKRRKSPAWLLAIRHWEDDLEYLRVTYYVGQCNFDWPPTE